MSAWLRVYTVYVCLAMGLYSLCLLGYGFIHFMSAWLRVYTVYVCLATGLFSLRLLGYGFIHFSEIQILLYFETIIYPRV